MPAVTADTLTLPRLDPPALDAVSRPVTRLTTAPSGFEGDGFPVRRAFFGATLAELDPFVHMDQMGEIDYGVGEPKGTPWHPHRGFETVTYLLEGTFLHQDSHGGGGVIENGGTQWMTAGAGILHIETPPDELVATGGLFHGIQLWVNLPAADKFAVPAYQNIEGTDTTLVSSPDGGTLVRITAGDVGAHRGPGSTHTPIAFVHATIAKGAKVEIPWRKDFNALVYVLSGAGTVGAAGGPIHTGQLAVLGDGDFVSLGADASQDSRSDALEVLVLGGLPIREHVEMYGPFVMNTKAELMQAVSDFNAGKLGTIPADGIMPHAATAEMIRSAQAPKN